MHFNAQAAFLADEKLLHLNKLFEEMKISFLLFRPNLLNSEPGASKVKADKKHLVRDSCL